MVRQEDPRFMHLKKKIFLFAVFSLVILGGAIVLIGNEKDLFTSKYELSFTVPKGTGFATGMPVKLSGFRIGRIKSISLNESASVDVVVQIDRRYQKWLRADSEAHLVKEGLIGETIIEVSAGSPAEPVLEENEQLTFVKTKGLDELAEEIGEKVKPVLLNVADIIAYANDPEGDLKQALHHIRALSAGLEDTRRQLDAMLAATGKDIHGVTGQIGTLVDDASRTVRTAERFFLEVEQTLPPILARAEETMQNAATLSGDLRETAGRTLPQVSPLLKGSGQLMEETDEVIQAVKGTWPISGRIRAPEERKFVPGDSHD